MTHTRADLLSRRASRSNLDTREAYSGWRQYQELSVQGCVAGGGRVRGDLRLHEWRPQRTCPGG